MAKKHTIETLTKDVNSFKRSTSGRFSAIKKILDDIQPQVEEMHDFIVEHRGFEKGQAQAGKEGSINISKDVWGIIWKLVLAIITLAGVNKLTS